MNAFYFQYGIACTYNLGDYCFSCLAPLICLWIKGCSYTYQLWWGFSWPPALQIAIPIYLSLKMQEKSVALKKQRGHCVGQVGCKNIFKLFQWRYLLNLIFFKLNKYFFKVMSTLTKPFCRSPIDTCIKKLDIRILHDCAVWHDVSWALMWVSFPTCLWHSFLPGKKNVNKLASMDSFFSETERYFSCQVVSLPPLLLSAESPIKEHFAYGIW